MNLIPIAIFAALNDEVRFIRAKLTVDEQIHVKPSLITRGQYQNTPLLLIRSGVGRSAMYRAVDYCLSNFRPTVCINVGYAGGTTPYTNAGDLIIASRVIDGIKKTSLQADVGLAERAEKLCIQRGLKAVTGNIVTVDRLVSSPHEKAFIGTEHDAIALDMESFAFMECCAAHSRPCIAVRAVLDPLDVVLPQMEDVIDESGNLVIGQMADHLIHHPKDALSIHKIEYCALKAREAITAFVDAWTS